MSADDDGNDGKKRLSRETIERMKKEMVYGVGYGRPPKEHQFKKGRSGNPKGRPRRVPTDLTLRDEPFLEIALELAEKPVRIREGDKVFEVPTIEALMRSGIAEALGGNARTLALVVDWIRSGHQARAREIKERIEMWTRYKDVFGGQLKDAARQGKPLPKLVPHPDDIEIDDDGVRFLGPRDDYEQKCMEETIRFRDVLIMQDALDERSQRRLDGEPLREPGGAIIFAMVLERFIPPRLRLSSHQFAVQQMRYASIPKRRLLKELYSAWRKLGRPLPRGYVFPDESVVAKNLKFVVDFAVAASSGGIDVDAISRGKFDDSFLDFLEDHGQPIEPYLQSGTQ